MLDLDAYCARIHYTGPRTPTLATLHALMAAHVEAIPFENLDVLLGRRLLLELPALTAKLVTARRGGYCFEQNGLFLAVLQAIGFDARPLSARVRLNRAPDAPAPPPRTHLFTRVMIDGVPWLADVGVGALSLTGAIRFDVEGEQPTPHEPRRLIRDGALWIHQARLAEKWTDVYEFTGEEMPPIDREVANWFTSTHPESHFRHRLVAARALPGGRRVTLANRELTIRAADGTPDVRTLGSPGELLAVLASQFGLEFPAGTRFSCAGLDWDR